MKRLLAMALALVMVLAMTACGGEEEKTVKSGVEDGVLTVGMECAYAPYNWAQTDDSNGAVKISNFDGYANGYDVMMAKKLCEANGWELEIKMLEWDSLVPAVMSGEIDCAIAGQSMTAEREKQGLCRSLPVRLHRGSDQGRFRAGFRYRHFPAYR